MDYLSTEGQLRGIANSKFCQSDPKREYPRSNRQHVKIDREKSKEEMNVTERSTVCSRFTSISKWVPLRVLTKICISASTNYGRTLLLSRLGGGSRSVLELSEETWKRRRRLEVSIRRQRGEIEHRKVRWVIFLTVLGLSRAAGSLLGSYMKQQL